MDRSPIDVETLTRIANELFSGSGASSPAPGSVEIPSAAQATAPAFGPNIDISHAAPTGPTAGGATFSPAAPPSRPAFGRPASSEIPGFGDGQPQLGVSPPSGFGPSGFDPQALPGFNPIPHVEDVFDVGALGLLGPGASSLQGFLPPTNVPGLAAAPGGINPISDIGGAGFNGFHPAPGANELPSAVPATASTFNTGLTQPFGLPAGGATASPSSPPTGPAFGRAVSTERPDVGYGIGQPRFGTNPTYDANGVHGIDPFGGMGGFDGAGIKSFLTPTDVPGFTGAPEAAQSLPFGTSRRSIDRPTPNAFEFTDAPHLGEFPEEKILRASLDPQNGAPAVEGLPDRAGPSPGPQAGLAPSPAPSFYFLNDGMDYFANDVPNVPRPSATPFNAEAVRADFPVLRQRVNGHPLVWLDNGATTQKPQAVIDRISSFYENENSNVSRSAHELAARATDAYEDARKTVQRFINAPSVDELVFVRGTTEGINFVANSFGKRFIKEGDEIVLTHAEHHANIVPWYLLAKETGAKLRVVPFDDSGEILLDEYEALLSDRVKIVAMTHVSNALGTVLPAKAMAEMAHRHGIPVLLDGAQSISHMPIDVQDLDCDFFVFSGHKVFAPTGIGAVYGKKALLDQMPPWQGGGNMIKDVTFEKITFQPAPGRFEAGTGNIADAVGLGEAFKYIERLGMTNIAQHEHALLDYATQRLAAIKGLTIIGTAKEKAGVISFLLEGKAPTEVGKALNQKGIAVRAGHHCALPILRRYGVEATVRPAFAMYNTFDDADRLAEAVREIAGT